MVYKQLAKRKVTRSKKDHTLRSPSFQKNPTKMKLRRPYFLAFGLLLVSLTQGAEKQVKNRGQKLKLKSGGNDIAKKVPKPINSYLFSNLGFLYVVSFAKGYLYQMSDKRS